MKKLLPRAHIESCFSEVGSIQYCKKGGDFFEQGQKTEPGKRNDLEQVKQAYKAGKTLGEIVDAAESFQAIQLAQKLAPYFEPKRSWKTEVKWFSVHLEPVKRDWRTKSLVRMSTKSTVQK